MNDGNKFIADYQRARTDEYRADVWARENGEHFRGTVALDNHEPTRAHGYVDCYRYSTATVSDAFIVCVRDAVGSSFAPDDGGMPTLKHATRAVYLMDTGDAVKPYYVAAWPPGDIEYVIAHPFPTTEDFCSECGIEMTVQLEGCDACFDRKRKNGFRPFTHESWSLGPRTAYHVKLRKV